MTHHSKRQPWSTQGEKGPQTQTTSCTGGGCEMDRSAFATRTGSFDLAVPLCHARRRPHHHRSLLCTPRGGGLDTPVVARVSLPHPTLPRGWCGKSCRCCGSIPKSWTLQRWSWAPLGKAGSGPILGAFLTHSLKFSLSGCLCFLPPCPECPCFIYSFVSRAPHCKEKKRCCSLEQFRGGGL